MRKKHQTVGATWYVTHEMHVDPRISYQIAFLYSNSLWRCVQKCVWSISDFDLWSRKPAVNHLYPMANGTSWTFQCPFIKELCPKLCMTDQWPWPLNLKIPKLIIRNQLSATKWHRFELYMSILSRVMATKRSFWPFSNPDLWPPKLYCVLMGNELSLIKTFTKTCW